MVYDSMMRATLIVITLLIALLLELLPLPGITVWLRPEWVLLTLVYWCMTYPSMGLLLPFITGLFLDLAHGTLLGEYTFSVLVVTYLVFKFYHRIRLFSLFQQSLIVFLLLMVYKTILWMIQGLLDQPPSIFFYSFSVMTSAILWPWITLFLSNFHKQTEIS